MLETLDKNHLRILEKLETLKIMPRSSSRPYNIFTKKIENLPNLKNLILNRVVLDELTFKGFCNLESLSLTNVIFSEKASKDLFKDLKNLKEFHLSSLNYKDKPKDHIIKDILSNIQVENITLKCSINSFKNIFSDPVSFFDKIKSVNIVFDYDYPEMNNFFLRLNEDFLPKLEISLLNISRIPDIDQQILKKIKTMKLLTWSQHLQRFATNWNTLEKSISKFANLKTLNLVNISSNFLLTEFCLENLINLEQLSLEFMLFNLNRSIDPLAINLFRNLKNLKKLKITGMNIEILRSTFFDFLINLEQLELSNNQIKVTEAGSFKNLNRLEILDLSDNSLEKVNKDTFIGLSNLKKLNLTRNLNIEITEDDLAELHKLEILNLFEFIQIKRTSFYLNI